MADIERLQRIVLDNGATDFDAVCTLIRAQLHHGLPTQAQTTRLRPPHQNVVG